jgi:hypothetical protein
MPAPWTPTSALAHAVYAAGFAYDPDQDIIYSRMDALQRNFGYAFGYDVAAPAMSAIIDCEPIFFDYAGKHWMIELWKGQYGLETGCEIGVYTRPIGSTSPVYALLDATIGKRPGDSVASHNLFYDCASDGDRLGLAMTLHRNGTPLFTRGPETHWWLTGFKWGVLSDPSELSVDLAITLKDAAMRDAFLAGIAGRPYANLNVSGTTVSFTFAQPFANPQPTIPAPVRASVDATNQEIVSAYNALGFPNNDPNQVQAEFLSVAGLGLLRLGDFFGLATSQAALGSGRDIATVVPTLANAFSVAAGTVEGWLNGISRSFSTWIKEIEDYLNLPLDFACYVMIDNTNGASDLLLTGSSAKYGSYVVSPPAWIPQGAVGRFVLQDPKPSVYGSEGTVTYSYCDGDLTMRTVVFSYECPTVSANKAASSQADWPCRAKSGNRNGQWRASVPAGGHPLYVSYATNSREPGVVAPRQVTHTRKDASGDITHLGGGVGANWSPVATAAAIQQIRSGARTYFTSANGHSSFVRVVEDPDGPYLRTAADGTTANNLDQLPDF